MKKLITKKRFILFFLYFLLAIVVFSFFDVYFLGYKTSLSKFATKIIPYPALVVNNDLVTINQYEGFLKRYESYLKELDVNMEGFNRQQLLKAMIQNMALEQVVSKLGISIDSKEFNGYVNNFYENNNISKIDKDKFTNYFLKPTFYKQKVLNKITDDNFNLDNKKKIEVIYNDLIKNPDNFSAYADLYKDEGLGIDGNLIGWLSYENLSESLRFKVDKMEINNFTPVIKSISGYHIYKLNGKIKNEDNNYYYQFDQVFLPIENFNNYLNNYLENSKIFYFLETTK